MERQRVALVTGGTYGIGRAITLRLAEAGYSVVAFGLDTPQVGSRANDGCAGTRAELDRVGLSAHLLEADVSSRSDVQEVVDFTVETYGRIDALVNNAAIHPLGTVLNTTESEWDKVIAVNLTGVFYCCRAVVPIMVENGGGAIVNVGSAAGWGRPYLFAYAASKGGVFALSAALAYDLRDHHIRVNVVVPGGWILTGMTESTPDEDAKRMSAAGQGTVAGRAVLPRDIANSINFLLSEEAEQVSGAIVNVGGFVMQGGMAGRDAFPGLVMLGSNDQ